MRWEVESAYEKKTGERVLSFVPIGSFAYRSRFCLPMGTYLPGQETTTLIGLMNNEITEQAERWPPLSSGLFGGSLERVKAAIEFSRTFFFSAWHPFHLADYNGVLKSP
jgi:hypothetical protein